MHHSPALLSLLCLALAAPVAVSCTPALEKVAVGVLDAGCVAVTSAEAPAAEPLCVYVSELATEVATYVREHDGNTPAVTDTASGTVVPVDMYTRLAARPPVRARRAVKRAAPCKGGSVAP